MGQWRGYINFCAPSGGKAFGLLKAQQEERLDEINKVKGGTKGLGLGEGAWTEGLSWLWLSPQQFLDDPKYNSDEDLLSKLEAFKSEGKTVGVDGRRGGRISPNTEWGGQRHSAAVVGRRKTASIALAASPSLASPSEQPPQFRCLHRALQPSPQPLLPLPDPSPAALPSIRSNPLLSSPPRPCSSSQSSPLLSPLTQRNTWSLTRMETEILVRKGGLGECAGLGAVPPPVLHWMGMRWFGKEPSYQD